MNYLPFDHVYFLLGNHISKMYTYTKGKVKCFNNESKEKMVKILLLAEVASKFLEILFL